MDSPKQLPYYWSTAKDKEIVEEIAHIKPPKIFKPSKRRTKCNWRSTGKR